MLENEEKWTKILKINNAPFGRAKKYREEKKILFTKI